MSSAADSSALQIDLWPKAKFEPDIVTPVSILRRQASLLGEKTQQLVTAEVASGVFGDEVVHFFRLVVPALDNYKYELFKVSHTVDRLYPVYGSSENAFPLPSLADQSAFVRWLREILSSESTLKKIDSLMAQARG